MLARAGSNFVAGGSVIFINDSIPFTGNFFQFERHDSFRRGLEIKIWAALPRTNSFQIVSEPPWIRNIAILRFNFRQ
jgi:hypothetical protein